MSNLTALNKVLLNNNLMSGNLSVFSKFSDLQIFNLHGNKFSGPFPLFLESLPRLLRVTLGGNEFQDVAPDKLGSMQRYAKSTIPGLNETLLYERLIVNRKWV